MKIQFSKIIEVVINGRIAVSGSMAAKINTFADYIDMYSHQESIEISWYTVESAPHSIEHQNNTMMRRAKKLADATGKTVTPVENLRGTIYGCKLI